MFPPEFYDAAASLLVDLEKQALHIATVESCTGGLLAALLTSVPGSSRVLDRAFVTYSNQAKSEMVGVSPALIEMHGAVSREVAIAMAEGALVHTKVDIAVSITGVAGPDGGSEAKPVGLVHLACARRYSDTAHVERRFGDIGREAVRLASVNQALALIQTSLKPRLAVDPS